MSNTPSGNARHSANGPHATEVTKVTAKTNGQSETPAIDPAIVETEAIPETRGAYLRLAQGFTAAQQGGKSGVKAPIGFTPTGDTEPRILRYLVTVKHIREYLAETDAEKRAEMVAGWGVEPTPTSSRVPFTVAEMDGWKALVSEYAATVEPLIIETDGETETESDTARMVRVATALTTGGILPSLRPEKAEKVKAEKADTTAAALSALFGA